MLNKPCTRPSNTLTEYRRQNTEKDRLQRSVQVFFSGVDSILGGGASYIFIMGKIKRGVADYFIVTKERSVFA